MSNREKAAQRKVDEFNAAVPVGTPVLYRKVRGGEEYPSRTRSEAWVMSGHGSVLLEGVSGSYSIDFVRKAP